MFSTTLIRAIAVLAILTSSGLASAADVLILYRPDLDKRPVVHGDFVLEEAMRRTVPKYGPYKIERHTSEIPRDRLLQEMAAGRVVNTAIVASQPAWEEQSIPVWIPIDMGLSGFRIGFVHKDNQETLSRGFNS